MVAVLLSLLASASWGAADFCGGFFSRRWPSLSVLLVIEAGGLITATTIVVLANDPFPDARHALTGVAAGVAGVTALALFYRALSIGTMSIVAPISATGAAVPVAVGVATGDELTALIVVGLVLAFAGVVLAGREAAPDNPAAAGTRLVVGLSLAAALGFGLFFTLYDTAADGSSAWAILLSRLPAVPVVALLVRRRGLAVPRGADLYRLVGVAQLDCAATSLYALAITRGALSIVAVVGSLYPVMTVLLARVVLRERVRRVQAVGVVVAFVGVALVSLGSA
ncbi:EamA family transporter [Paraconexibacter antarcticus]|uniref:EamA family transporter n=1 Tax=Paraconexibacter antarcticus TaxID=2949664 RepID=A0ABY5DS49_9ACTN|nr:EamA family transporter [Paraconexibacter antarcticus]UTI64850.1 EamA family transporter [Paraconexibacter antarcticus]